MPRHHWAALENQRNFFLSFKSQKEGSHLNQVTQGDATIEYDDAFVQFWYRVSTSEIRKWGGNAILNRYRGSLYRALKVCSSVRLRFKTSQEVFPTVKWLPWLFSSSPRNFWKKTENVKAYLDYVGNTLHVQLPHQWYRVSQQQFKEIGGIGFLHSFPNLVSALRQAYPSISWDASLFSNKNKKSSQMYVPPPSSLTILIRWLLASLRQVTSRPDLLVEEFDLSLIALEPREIAGGRRKKMPIDVYLKHHDVAFEYQGEHHYHSSSAFRLPSHIYEERDIAKR